MNKVTIYDSMYEHKGNARALKPINHLQCNLSLHNESYDLLRTANVADTKAQFPNLLAVLTELPEVSFNSNWGEGAITVSVGPIDQLMSGNVGSFVKMFANSNFVSLSHTNEFSQHIMQEGSTMSLNLKFRIYADTYNQRYRFMTSTYESWLKYLYFATTPLLPMSYGNLFRNVNAAAGNIINTGAETLPHLKEAFMAAGSALASVVAEGQVNSETQAQTQKLLEEINAIAEKITKLTLNATTFGHVVFDLEIPGYIHSTKNNDMKSKVYWIVTGFTATPCPQFLRGVDAGISKSEAEAIQGSREYGHQKYRPKPLYMDFNVKLETNQVVTREQYIAMLVGNNAKAKSTASQAATDAAAAGAAAAAARSSSRR